MEKPPRQSQAHLFTVQLWLEDLGNGQAEWRGQVKNVANGEERYFRQWSVLGRLLKAMLAKVDDKIIKNQMQPK
jgi:hypothetical protein